MMDFAIARRKKWLWVPAAVILIAVILTCVFAPFIIKHYLNHRVFRDMGNYTGRVNDVDVNVLRGSYVLRDLVLWRKEGNLDVPFFKVKGFYISISWEALWHGSLLASVVLEEGELNFLDARKPEERQSGTGTNWLSVLDKLLPTTLHRLGPRLRFWMAPNSKRTPDLTPLTLTILTLPVKCAISICHRSTASPPIISMWILRMDAVSSMWNSPQRKAS
jgi:hypothetical protein